MSVYISTKVTLYSVLLCVGKLLGDDTNYIIIHSFIFINYGKQSNYFALIRDLARAVGELNDDN